MQTETTPTENLDVFKIELAGIGIELHPIKKKRLHSFCAQYLNEDIEAKFSVVTTAEDLKEEDEISIKALGHAVGSDFEREKLFIYRTIAEHLTTYDTLLMHAVAVSVDGIGYIFAGPSGAGKSTHAKLWKQAFGDRMKYINDDKPLIRITNDEVRVFGSPWTGKEHFQNNISAPLKSIIFINQADENSIAPISKTESWDLMINQIYRSKEPEAMKNTLKLIDLMISKVPVHKLYCTMEPEAAQLAYGVIET